MAYTDMHSSHMSHNGSKNTNTPTSKVNDTVNKEIGMNITEIGNDLNDKLPWKIRENEKNLFANKICLL